MTAAVELPNHDVAFGGKESAHANGKAVFVPYVIDGETVSASITANTKNFSKRNWKALLRPRPIGSSRAVRTSDVAGCVYQHIDYEHQRP